MRFSSKQEQLRQLLKEQYASLQQTFPIDRYQNLLALVRSSNRYYLENQQFNTASYISYSTSGLQKALSLCISTEGSQATTTLDSWADSTLQACCRLVEAERVLAYCDTGFMHMQQDNEADYKVWVASKKMPTEWREHEDIVAWTNLIRQTYTAEFHTLSTEKAYIQQQIADFARQWNGQASALYKTTRTIDDYYSRLGALHVKCMVAYTTYLASTIIGSCTFAVYRDVLGVLIGLALKQVDAQRIRRNVVGTTFTASTCDLSPMSCQNLTSNEPTTSQRSIVSELATLRNCIANELAMDAVNVVPTKDLALIETLAETLALDRATVRLALDAFTLDAENASYHASTMEVPAPPLIRLDEQHRIVSLEGLFTYPLFFLLRELKHWYSSEYHTASQLREEVFRQDVYALFADKRFVKSAGHVELRGTKGTLTTDVDALIFDRKTGALALFELKSQDPFAYSLQERIRQRDYFYSASRQVIASNEWVKRNGANVLLSRLDSKQVKRLKAQHVYIFVLGRYLAHFFDGPPFDSRAAWGTWSQVLRLTQGKPFGADDTNPIQSLYNKLMRDMPLALNDKPHELQEIEIAGNRIRVYPSFEVYRRNVQRNS